jgi:hypothetical protein
MTPIKCNAHEYQPGEDADGPRYTKARRDSLTCWRCRVLIVLARLQMWAEGPPPPPRF